MTNVDLLLRFCLQLATILIACRLVGILGRRLGQAQAVSEMITGVLLGPSLFGVLFPAAHDWLFPATATVTGHAATPDGGAVTVVIPHPSMAILYVLAQLGIGLYMFLVGLEFNVDLLRPQGRQAGKVAAAVSVAGIAVPFALGAGTAMLLLAHGGGGATSLFGAGASPLVVTFFLGLSLSITAFPVLARILQEQRAAHTLLGTLAIGAAALDDAIAWCLLAVLLSIDTGVAGIALLTLAGTTLYVLAMMTVGRWGFRWLARQAGTTTDEPADVQTGTRLSPAVLSLTIGVVLLCCWLTTAIGIHAIFGAFIAGLVVPRGHYIEALRAHLEPVTLGIFVPIFFVYSGLETQVGLLNSPSLWLIAILITALAVLGKGPACLLAARAGGQTWRDSAAIGALMNSRGLIELILLDIGLERRLITPTLFTMLVLMAIVTTALTTPLFRALYPRIPIPASAEAWRIGFPPSGTAPAET